MRRLAAAFAFAFALAIWFAPAAVHAETFDWPGHGKVSVTVPEGWNVKPKYNKLAFYLMAEPEAGPHVNLQLTLAEPTPKLLKKEQLKDWLEGSTRDFVKGSVEKAFDPKPLALSQGSGLFVELTDASEVDKPVRPGKYKLQRSGVAFLDDRAMLIATILFNNPSQPEVEQAMSMLSSLRFERSAAKAEASSTSAAPFTFTLPQSRVVVKVADPSLRPDNASGGGPNYFKVSREEPQLILSGWLSPASAYKGIKWLWDTESRKLASNKMAGVSLSAPTRVETLRVGPWDVVAYDIDIGTPTLKATGVHLRAERVLAGTWVDLHLSKTSNEPPAKLRAELLDALRKVEVVEK